MKIIKPIPQPKPDTTFEQYAWMIYAAWLLFGIGHYFFVNHDLTSIKIVAPSVLLLKSLYNLYTIQQIKDPKLTIDDTGIRWEFEDLEKEETVKWSEIGVVRIEENRIILYIGSSLARVIDLKLFEPGDHEFLLSTVAQFAIEQGLPFTNASTARLA